MKNIFPEAIKALPKADIPLEGLTAYLSQGKKHQILFMSFDEDIILEEHVHDSQYGIVLEGQIELTIAGSKKMYRKGDRYYIPSGIKHSGKIYAGYSDITFFNESDRYKVINDETV